MSRSLQVVYDRSPSCRSSKGPIHGRCDPAALIHELSEGGRRDRLGAVADGVFWIVVNLKDQGVGAGGDSGPGHRDDKLRFAGAVAKVTLYVKLVFRALYDEILATCPPDLGGRPHRRCTALP